MKYHVENCTLRDIDKYIIEIFSVKIVNPIMIV